MSELAIQRCETCGTGLFPDRLRCPSCGDVRLARIPAGPGQVEEETQLRRPPEPAHEPVRLGSVRLETGPVVIARLDEQTRTGDRVRLELTPDRVIWTRVPRL